jgi:hypothetical protein
MTPIDAYWHLRIACLIGGIEPVCLLVLFVAAAMCWYDVLVRVNDWVRKNVM